MSIFKSICADIGDPFVANRVSFGGGFQMPKHEERGKPVEFEEKIRKTASFQTENRDTGKQNLLASIDQEISKLKGDSKSVAEVRVKNNLEFPTQNLNSLEEIEKLRLVHQEKLKVLEAEYLEKKKKESKPVPSDVLSDYSEYKKVKNINKAKFTHNLNYVHEDPGDEKETLLKWIFSKLDIDSSGMIEKNEMLQEIARNQELREYFGIGENADLISELSELMPSDFLSQKDFLNFFLSIRPISAKVVEKPLPVVVHTKTSPHEYPIVVLTERQLKDFERVFKETDIHGDMAVQKFEYLQSLRTDDDIIKILGLNAIEISKGTFVTIEEVFDRLQDTDDLYEYITYSQFLNYFYVMFPKQNWVAEELEKKVELDPLYVQILRDIFDSLPRKSKDMVSVKVLIESLKEDPQVKEFLLEKARGTENVEKVLHRVNRESAETITWEDFIDYFSTKGKPPLRAQEANMVNRGNYYAMKQDFYKPNQSQSPEDSKAKFKYEFHSKNGEKSSKTQKKKKKHSDSTIKFTVPAPFEFEQREKDKHKSIRQLKFEQYINEKKREEDNHINYHTIAVPVPAEVVIPKYNTMMAAQEARRNDVKKNSKKITKDREKLFEFYVRELNKPKVEEVREEPFKFKAKPPPASNSVPLYEQMSRKGEEDRKSRIEIAAKKALEEAKMPSRMERYAKGDKTLSVQPQKIQSFKAKKPPEFTKLWENLGKSMDKRKQSFQPTQAKEFNFSEAKKKSQAEDVNEELMKKGFLEMFKKKSVNLDPPKDLPKPTKKQVENEENAKKRREELRKQDEEKKKIEEEKKNIEEEAQKKRDLKSQKDAEESKKKAMEGKERIKEMDEKYAEDKKRMQEKVNSRVPISQTISSEYSKTNSMPRSLASIKEKMKARGIPISNIIGEEEGFFDVIAEDLV